MDGNNILREAGWEWEEFQKKPLGGKFKIIGVWTVLLIFCIMFAYRWSSNFALPLHSAIEREIQKYKGGEYTLIQTISSISIYVVVYPTWGLFIDYIDNDFIKWKASLDKLPEYCTEQEAK